MEDNKYLLFFLQYDVQNVGSAGGGGEYEVVVGFGWSNGAVMDLLVKYGDVLEAPDLGDGGETTPTPTPAPGSGALASWSLPTILVTLCMGIMNNVLNV